MVCLRRYKAAGIHGQRRRWYTKPSEHKRAEKSNERLPTSYDGTIKARLAVNHGDFAIYTFDANDVFGLMTPITEYSGIS